MKNDEEIITSNQLVLDFDAKEIVPEVIIPEPVYVAEVIPEKIEPDFIPGDINNIAKMLPLLYHGQHQNVAFAEKRFQEGKGVMFTDGTGTGKTFTGCGIIYRFYYQGKKEIVIVVPTDQKCIDWIEEGAKLGLSIYHIQNTKDPGFEITVTTYANFYKNEALLKRLLDLLVYDESHYLGQNASGIETSYFEQHKKVANLPTACRERAREMHQELKPNYDGSTSWYEQSKYYEKIIQLTVERFVIQTKVVFLSATPFAYHKSIKYADGTLLEIEEKLIVEQKSYRNYNEAPPFGDFLVTNFGYQMKYDKVTIPESGVDVNLLERQFFENMKEKGIISTRVLELEQDYSRDFVTLDSDIGDFINEGMEEFFTPNFQKTFPILYNKFSTKYNYMYINQLLECIKAREVIPRIQQHLDLGRKVVIFHAYNHAAVEHPFRFSASRLLKSDEKILIPKLTREIELYQKLYPEYYNLDLSSLENVRDVIVKAFPDTKQFNGTIPKKKRQESLKDFNNDYGNTNILLVQNKAGKEGISLHDKTGLYQRVLIQLGLATEPTGCIQIEGRTYRDGVKSNAPYEYMTVQTTFERIAFGEKIATRSRTAENLAMGNLARNLEASFKEGYLNSSHKPPSLEQGIGGKAMDKFNNDITPFDKAITYYYSRAKRNSKTKAKEGGDYFATPEPLGFKMVQWAKPCPNDRGLEPSAGHGAIARFFPGDTTNHFIEQNINLTGELCINSTGTVKIEDFEIHNSINKYDFVVMNPPFGSSGKLAMDHLEKVMVKHTERYHGRIISIVPSGPTMDKRLQLFLKSEKGMKFYIKTEIQLPSCVFTRAGTNVSTKVLEIIKVNHQDYKEETRKIDLSHIESIKDFFEEIRYLEI